MEKYILKISNENSLDKTYTLIKIEEYEKETILIEKSPFYILEDVLQRISKKRIDENIEKEIILYNKIVEKLGLRDKYLFKLDIAEGKYVYFYRKIGNKSLACESSFTVDLGLDDLHNWFVEQLSPFYEKNYGLKIKNWQEEISDLNEKIEDIEIKIIDYKNGIKYKLKELLSETRKEN